jgi:16S rRNA processing protein RimM
METISKENCCKIGFIRKNHGVHGAVIFEFDPSFGDSVEETSRFFLNIDGLLVPFFVAENGLRMKSAKTAFVSFDGVHTEKYARRLVGCTVYLFKADIIDVPDEPVSSDYRDYRLFDVESGEVGIITDMEDFSGNRVMMVSSGGTEMLIPFNEALLVSVDHKQKTLTVQLPDGMIDRDF